MSLGRASFDRGTIRYRMIRGRSQRSECARKAYMSYSYTISRGALVLKFGKARSCCGRSKQCLMTLKAHPFRGHITTFDLFRRAIQDCFTLRDSRLRIPNWSVTAAQEWTSKQDEPPRRSSKIYGGLLAPSLLNPHTTPYAALIAHASSGEGVPEIRDTPAETFGTRQVGGDHSRKCFWRYGE